MFEHIKIILVGTTHPGNIGAAARAMKVMGLTQLVLVSPKQFPCAEASARASGADDVLNNAQVYDTLTEAVQDCQWVVGTSARDRSIQWPQLNPPECALQLAQHPEKVALVFGREHSGLSNEELDHCHVLLRIDSNPDYSSLNLAAAVQLMAYELRNVYLRQQPSEPVELPRWERGVDQQAMENFYQHLEQTLIDIDFLDPDAPRRLMRRLRRLYNKATPCVSEMNILRGILSATQTAAKSNANSD